MKIIIAAGGRGTRIQSVASDIPKPLIPIDGKPILEREIDSLRDQGFKDIIITVSHMADKIMDYFGNGDRFGVNIEYYIEEKPLGNAGAIFKIKEQLNEDFLLLIADALFDIDFNRFVAYHKEKGGLVTLFTHPNSHPYDSSIVVADESKSVNAWLTKEDERPLYYENRVNAGLHVISLGIFDVVNVNLDNVGNINEDGVTLKVDLDRDLLKPLCGSGKMYCYDSPEYCKDMGTPDRFEAVTKDLKEGLVEAKNLRNKQKAVFLDRDGTINKHIGLLRKTDEFELLPGVAEAIKKINSSGYLAIVITNQPVIARGEVTQNGLKEIHNKMETMLGQYGAYIDEIYYCPNHPDKGFEGEVPGLKIDCDCRKPKPGLILRAAQDFNIDLSQSWMIGDGANDIGAGKNAGCKTALIAKDNTDTYGEDIRVNSVLDFVSRFLC